MVLEVYNEGCMDYSYDFGCFLYLLDVIVGVFFVEGIGLEL